jgi:hypothetical protein
VPAHLDALASIQRVAASPASIPEAVAAEHFFRVFARQDASVKSVANQVDQPEITNTHERRGKLAPGGAEHHMTSDLRKYCGHRLGLARGWLGAIRRTTEVSWR